MYFVHNPSDRQSQIMGYVMNVANIFLDIIYYIVSLFAKTEPHLSNDFNYNPRLTMTLTEKDSLESGFFLLFFKSAVPIVQLNMCT